MADHPRLVEALENIDKAVRNNRGIYPYTKATNVFKEDGTPLEVVEDAAEGEGTEGEAGSGADGQQ